MVISSRNQQSIPKCSTIPTHTQTHAHTLGHTTVECFPSPIVDQFSMIRNNRLGRTCTTLVGANVLALRQSLINIIARSVNYVAPDYT